jgi:DNA mismatch repair protein MutS
MFVDEVNALLNAKKRLLTEIYFDLQTLYEEKYGTNTVILMEIGTFFEVYEVDNSEDKVGKAKEISELLNIQLTRKNKTILENSRKNPLMAGVPAVAMERYLNRLISEEKYTIVVIRQKGVPPKLSRYVDTIVSPGTNFDFLDSKEENFLTSLMVDINRGIYSIAYSAIDVTTGKTYLLESHSTSSDKSYALDEAFNLLTTHKTKEVVLSAAVPEVDLNEVIRYLELDTHYKYVINKSRFKLSYQNRLFKEVYRIESMLSPIEFLDLERNMLLSENLAILVDFIVGHDSNIVQKLAYPKKLASQRFLYFGNSASEQLGVI